jgi:hypothetical protein
MFRQVRSSYAPILFAVVFSIACPELRAENLTLDLRTHTESSKYFVSMAAYPRGPNSNFGHAFVIWGEENAEKRQSTFKAYGLYRYPDVPLNANIFANLVFYGAVPAEIIDEVQKGLNQGSGRGAVEITSDYITLIVDRSDYYSSLSVLNSMSPRYATGSLDVTFDNFQDYSTSVDIRDFSSYTPVLNDCVTFAETTFRFLGVNPPEPNWRARNPSLWLPQAYVRALSHTIVSQGTVVTSDGTYTGQMVGRWPNGIGKWTYKDGATYEGSVGKGS